VDVPALQKQMEKAVAKQDPKQLREDTLNALLFLQTPIFRDGPDALAFI